MDFCVGFIDRLFGERIPLEVPGPDGKIITRNVTKKWLDRMIAEGKMSPVSGGRRTVTAHILDPVNGYTLETWVVGDNVQPELVQKFGNKSKNAIYVLRCYRDGKLESNILRQDLWNQAKKQIHSV
jgi:hypothetical protein